MIAVDVGSLILTSCYCYCWLLLLMLLLQLFFLLEHCCSSSDLKLAAGSST